MFTAGVTIFVATGDDGVAGPNARHNPLACGYVANFPADSPYVTAVGATQGNPLTGSEIVCQGNQGGSITSGGGFSTLYPAPSWQTAAIAQYFKVVTPAPQSG